MLFDHFIRFEHLLTPIAIEQWTTGRRNYRTLHIFGLRVAYWA